MRFFKQIAIMLAAITLLGTVQLQASTLLQEEHGVKATSFLELLDQGKLPEAWQTMAPLFRALNIQQHWQQRIASIRQAYGASIKREFRRSSYRTSYRNAPDGEYVIIQFDTSFEHKAKGVETVVLQCLPSQECAVTDYVIN